jgi:hypothetical protein
LQAISKAETAISGNRQILSAILKDKGLQKQYDSLRDTRAKHITATAKTTAQRMKPE